MPAKPRAINPFYALLIVAGVAFVLTACAYCVMALKAARPNNGQALTALDKALLEFLDRQGAALMAGELAVLAVATVAAIATDRYWMRRDYERRRAIEPKQAPHEP